MHFLLKELLEPMLTRAGTAIAGALVGVGMAAGDGPTVANTVVIVGLVLVDLASDKFRKKKG